VCNIKFFYDLHIHSTLSPDGDILMTPNNILNMAMLKGLDIVAITDHNSAKQLHTIEDIETAYDFVIIPGIEVTVEEGFDVLCYFKRYTDAYALDCFIEDHLVDDDWGPFSQDDQVITDIYDTTVETYDKSLRSTKIPYRILVHKVRQLDGILVLAHVDRTSKSALLDHPIEAYDCDGIEIQPYAKQAFLESHPELKSYRILSSSDAHDLLAIQERTEALELDELSIEAFFSYFKGSETHD